MNRETFDCVLDDRPHRRSGAGHRMCRGPETELLAGRTGIRKGRSYEHERS